MHLLSVAASALCLTVALGQTCENGLEGISNKDVCCTLGCGQCGGSGCSTIVGFSGDECCTDNISSVGPLCSVSGAAPCFMGDVLPGTPAPVAVPVPEPGAALFCSNGLSGFENKDICCVEGCGQCGGSGCSTIPGFTADECCTANIEANGVLCSVSGAAPCIQGTDVPIVEPTTPGPVAATVPTPGPVAAVVTTPGPVAAVAPPTPGPVAADPPTPGPVAAVVTTPGPVAADPPTPGPVAAVVTTPGPVAVVDPPTPGPVAAVVTTPGPVAAAPPTPGPVATVVTTPGPVAAAPPTPGPVAAVVETGSPVVPEEPEVMPFVCSGDVGIQQEDVCCEASCGTCGGSGCSGRGNGQFSCCTANIRDVGVYCSETGSAPCIIDASTGPTPTPGPSFTCSGDAGVLKGDACCEASCGTCGGSGCHARGNGSESCCTRKIAEAGVYCADSGAAPCIVEGYQNLGCYADMKESRIMKTMTSSESMTAEACSEICGGSEYFGTQWGQECWCDISSGMTFDEYGASDVCDFPCTGDESEICGGYTAMTVYINV